MRYIDAALKAKLLLAHQTIYNNAEPYIEVVAARPKIPISSKEFWEEVIVTPGVTSISTSVAVRKEGRVADRAYVAYVHTDGTLVVKSALMTYPVSNMIWEVETSINNCLACALDFSGTFIRNGKYVEYRSEEAPWLFYVTSGGALYGGILGGTYESLVGANVTAIDVIKGVASLYNELDQGLIVFYVISGSLYYKQLINGVWEGQEAVGLAPADVVTFHAERTFDYRIVLQVTDSAGALHEIFSKMEASGWNGVEFIELSGVTAQTAMYEIEYSEYQDGAEHIGMEIDNVGYPIPMLMSLYSPVLLSAWNIPTTVEDEDYPYDIYEDSGFRVVFKFDQYIPNAPSYPWHFKITDHYGIIWYGQSATVDHEEVTVTFNNFNNATNTITASAMAGQLWNGLTMLEETSITFDATDLVPYYVEPPVPLMIENIQNYEMGDD